MKVSQSFRFSYWYIDTDMKYKISKVPAEITARKRPPLHWEERNLLLRTKILAVSFPPLSPNESSARSLVFWWHHQPRTIWQLFSWALSFALYPVKKQCVLTPWLRCFSLVRSCDISLIQRLDELRARHSQHCVEVSEKTSPSPFSRTSSSNSHVYIEAERET